MSDEMLITGPLEVLRLTRVCPADRGTRFGRDAESCWAAVTDSKVLVVARWHPPAVPTLAPVGTDVAFGGACVAALMRAAWKEKPFRRFASTFAVRVEGPTLEVVAPGVQPESRGGTLRLTTTPPGKCPPVLELERHMRKPPAPPGDAPTVMLPVYCDAIGSLFAAMTERYDAEQPGVLPRLVSMAGTESSTAVAWCYELGHLAGGVALPMGLRVRALVMPLSVGLAADAAGRG